MVYYDRLVLYRGVVIIKCICIMLNILWLYCNKNLNLSFFCVNFDIKIRCFVSDGL